MNITWNELTVDFQNQNPSDLLQDWRWLLGDSMRLLIVSSLGDMFLADADGKVFWLDTGAGHLEKVAESTEDFKTLMQQRENADQWFVPQLVGDLMARGLRLAPDQCYSYRKPTILGGKMEPANFEPCDLLVHFSVLGQLVRQVKDLPPGTEIKDIRIEGL